MKKIIAVALWPYVYILDFIIYLTGAQTFKQARAVSRKHFNRILSRQEVAQTQD